MLSKIPLRRVPMLARLVGIGIVKYSEELSWILIWVLAHGVGKLDMLPLVVWNEFVKCVCGFGTEHFTPLNMGS